MKAQSQIQKIIAQHPNCVEQLFQLYGIKLPVNAQNVQDALWVNGDDFAQLFWSIGETSFLGLGNSSNNDTTPKDKDFTFIVVLAVVLIIVLSIAALTTAKNG